MRDLCSMGPAQERRTRSGDEDALRVEGEKKRQERREKPRNGQIDGLDPNLR